MRKCAAVDREDRPDSPSICGAGVLQMRPARGAASPYAASRLETGAYIHHRPAHMGPEIRQGEGNASLSVISTD